MISVYVVYKDPKDFPGKWVIRVHRVGEGLVVADVLPLVVADSLPDARAALPGGLLNHGRLPYDDPAIEEVWL